MAIDLGLQVNGTCGFTGELATIFNNPFIEPVMDIPDVKHSQREKRYHAYRWTSTGWYVMLWYCYRGPDTIRIIGGRKLK